MKASSCAARAASANMAMPAHYFISGLWGTNFADGRGNVAVNAEYARQQQYFGAGRPFIASQDAFLVVDSDPLARPTAPTAFPTACSSSDIRRRSLTNTGAVRFGGTTAGKQLRHGPAGVLLPLRLHLPAGRNAGSRDRRRASASPRAASLAATARISAAATSSSCRRSSTATTSICSPTSTSSAAFTPFVEAKYSRTDSSRHRQFRPGVHPGHDPGRSSCSLSSAAANREQFRLDNPFLDPQARDADLRDSVRLQRPDRLRRIPRRLTNPSRTCGPGRPYRRRPRARPSASSAAFAATSGTTGTTKFRSTTAS